MDQDTKDNAPGGCVKRYVVNLDRSKERMAWFDRQAAAKKLDFVRVSAVDGKALTEAELISFHRRCTRDRSISFGELGCFLSHVQIWKQMRDERTPWAFIAEDDVHFGLGADSFIGRDDWLVPGADIVKAETMLTRVEMAATPSVSTRGHHVRTLRSFHGGSAGYFLSGRGATRLLALADHHCEPVDHFVFAPTHHTGHGLVIAQLDPAICIQDDQLQTGAGLTSDLDPERDEFLRHHPLSRKPRGTRKILREIRRAGGYARNGMRRLGLSLTGASIFATVPINLDGVRITERKKPRTRPERRQLADN